MVCLGSWVLSGKISPDVAASDSTCRHVVLSQVSSETCPAAIPFNIVDDNDEDALSLETQHKNTEESSADWSRESSNSSVHPLSQSYEPQTMVIPQYLHQRPVLLDGAVTVADTENCVSAPNAVKVSPFEEKERLSCQRQCHGGLVVDGDRVVTNSRDGVDRGARSERRPSLESVLPEQGASEVAEQHMNLLRSENASLQASLSRQQALASSLSQDLALCLSENKALLAERDSLAGKISALECEIENLEGQLAAHWQINSDENHLIQLVRTLQEANSKQAIAVTEKDGHLAALSTKIADLRRELVAKSFHVGRIEADRLVLVESLENMDRRLQDVEASVDARVGAVVSTYEGRLVSEREKNCALVSELESFKAIVKGTRDFMTHGDDRRLPLVAVNDVAIRHVTATQLSSASLEREDVTNLKARILTLEDAVNDKDAQLVRAEAKLGAMRRTLAEQAALTTGTVLNEEGITVMITNSQDVTNGQRDECVRVFGDLLNLIAEKRRALRLSTQLTPVLAVTMLGRFCVILGRFISRAVKRHRSSKLRQRPQTERGHLFGTRIGSVNVFGNVPASALVHPLFRSEHKRYNILTECESSERSYVQFLALAIDQYAVGLAGGRWVLDGAHDTATAVAVHRHTPEVALADAVTIRKIFGNMNGLLHMHRSFVSLLHAMLSDRTSAKMAVGPVLKNFAFSLMEPYAIYVRTYGRK